VLKACTGTFVPLRQYLFFDAVEALPEELPAENDCR
jgi:ubiquitin-activating enzyme E1